MQGRVWSCIVSAAQTWTVGVTGGTGYAGGEVCRLLAGHPNLRLAGVHANASAGRLRGAFHEQCRCDPASGVATELVTGVHRHGPDRSGTGGQ